MTASHVQDKVGDLGIRSSVNSLQVLSCRMHDIGSQRCWLGPLFMSSLGIRLYDVVRIHYEHRRSCICRAWPRLDACGNNYVHFDPTVINSSDGQIHCSTGDINSAELIPRDGIQKLTCSALESLVVTVVLTRRSELHKYRNVTFDIKNRMRHLLDGMVVCPKHEILCSRRSLGPLFGCDRIIVHEATTRKGTDCGFVADSTDIEIVKFVSKEKFTQQQGSSVKLGGLEQVSQLLKEIITESCRSSSPQNKFSAVDHCVKGILLTGPSGCGKTSLAKHVAFECDAYLHQIDASVHGSRPGESEQNLRREFQQAIDAAVEGPCILLLEELDTVCPRSHSENDDSLGRRMLAELLCLMDDLQNKAPGLVVIATTSQPSNVDPSLRRIGRFEKEIFLGIPDESQRLRILEIVVPRQALASDIDLSYVASATPGYTGADLTTLVRLSGVNALQRLYDSKHHTVKMSELKISAADFMSALHNSRPSSQRGSDIFITSTRSMGWDDIGGLEDVKKKLKQSIEWPLKYPEAFECLGLQPARGILLYGPPGCAKTSLVRAAAASCNVSFLAVSGAQLYSPYLGDAEKKITEVFHQARSCAPSLLFIDEIDSVIGSRASGADGHGSGGVGVQQRVLSTLLNEMDGIGIHVDDALHTSHRKIAENEGLSDLSPGEDTQQKPVNNANVLVVAATNRIDLVDTALLRPGRMDHVIFVPPPGFQERCEILKVHTRKKPLVDFDVEYVAKCTEGFTGADLENLCNEASLHAVHSDGFNCQHVSGKHFEAVLQRLKPSVNLDDLQKYCRLKH